MKNITKDQSRSFYNNFAAQQRITGVNSRHTSIFNKALSLGLKTNHSVLEIGCGIGTLSSLLIPYLRYGELFSCDLSPESIKVAQEAFAQWQNCEFHVLDGSEFILDRKFDMVIMPDSCEHIPVEHHNRMFKNISKMLKDDGILYIHIPHPYNLDWFRVYEKDKLQIIDQSLYLNEFCKTIEDTDFYVFSEEPYNVWSSLRLGEWWGKYTHRVLRKKEDFSDPKHAPKPAETLMPETKIKSKLKRIPFLVSIVRLLRKTFGRAV